MIRNELPNYGTGTSDSEELTLKYGNRIENYLPYHTFDTNEINTRNRKRVTPRSTLRSEDAVGGCGGGFLTY
ncbi:unnamed protein product [Macrosiphum euphorbiae]|uniref:Uncharacterized protein n=1 Tax=Macrosiphum euphorbiae TaxID=13131 RepID=A0AAV0WWQ0_9HEMI|nr:unnamed protein product [Macrosiphum euphorbiae]